MKAQIKTVEMDVTPAQAIIWLEDLRKRVEAGTFIQRKKKDSTVNSYALDMKNGSWQFTQDAIMWDTEGNLINGQHRLEAVVKSGCTIRFYISTGWPPETMDALDAGDGRTVRTKMAMRGWDHAAAYAACARLAANIAWMHTSRASYRGTLYVLDTIGLRKNISRLLLKAQSPRDFNPRIIGPLAVYHHTRPIKAEQFAEDLFNITPAKGSAVHTYLKWMKTKHNSYDHMKGFCAAIRAWDANETPQNIRPNIEAVKWLCELDPKFSANVRGVTISTGHVHVLNNGGDTK